MRPLDFVANYYTDKVRAYGATAAGVDWRDKASQDLRFSKLASITRRSNSGSLIDVGCGWGAFALWATDKGYDLDYLGFDISQAMIDVAKEACSDIPSARFALGACDFGHADWVIASGIFNVRGETPDKEWREHVDTTINEMAKAAKIGFAFNCLTGFSDANRKDPRLYYPYPGDMLDSIMKRHGRHANLYHEYGLYEFTICCWPKG